MGEMADMALDDTMDMEDLRLDYHTGNLTIEEAYDAGLIDELGYEYGSEHGISAVDPSNIELLRNRP